MKEMGKTTNEKLAQAKRDSEYDANIFIQDMLNRESTKNSPEMVTAISKLFQAIHQSN